VRGGPERRLLAGHVGSDRIDRSVELVLKQSGGKCFEVTAAAVRSTVAVFGRLSPSFFHFS